MQRKRTGGFTLVELMVTIAIVGILVAVAFPSFEGSLRSNRVATRTNELIGSLSLARSEALRNPGGALICSSVNGTACDGTWNDGWLVWLDVDGDGDADIDGPDRVIRSVAGNSRLLLTATAAAPALATIIRFDARGRIDGGSARILSLGPDMCPGVQELKRRIEVRPTGQVQTTKVACP